MPIQNIIGKLKTIKSLHPPKPYLQIVNAISKTPMFSPPKTMDTTAISFLSHLDLNSLHLILSDPNVRSSVCFKFFNFLVKNRSFVSVKPDLQAHLTLISRLLKSRNFSQAENLLRSVSVGENCDYPFPVIASTV
ncbi:hypothetical protein L484_007489 [Morus notabilis]|nr:hypothetical protein L484_007489 [Morus notabilis]